MGTSITSLLLSLISVWKVRFSCFISLGGGPRGGGRVSFETSFDSKQPKLEPKLVSVLSETKCLFRLFRFYTKTESFDVSIEPKQTEDQPKQFKSEYVLYKRYVQLSHLLPVTAHILGSIF
jgi:hypothetical protein